MKERADGYIKDAEKELARLDDHDTAWGPLNQLIKLAQEDFQTGAE